MPYLSNSVNEAKNPELIDACKYVLVDYINNVLVDETPVIYPNTGFKVYQKRTLTAGKILSGLDTYAQKMAILVAFCYPNIVYEIGASNNPLHRWLVDNKACEWGYRDAANYSNVGIGGQIFDALSEVNASDLL